MTDRGFFLVLEGVEGAGKTTQARLISRWLEERDVPHQLAREPGGTLVGETVRRVLLESDGLEIAPQAELLLMLAARSAFVHEIVQPALARGEVMVADRFELSSLAYQGVGRGLGLKRVRELNAFATGGLRPDLTLVFDLPVTVGQARQATAGKKRDRIEKEGTALLESVREAYRRLADEDGAVRLVDGSPPAAEVHRTVRELLKSGFPEPFDCRRC